MSGDRPFLRRVVINTAATGASNAWAIGVSLLTLPVILHGLGAEAFGLWVLIQTFSVFTGWGALVDIGLGVASTRAIAARASVQDHGACDRLATAAVALSVMAAAAAATLLFLFGPAVLSELFRVPDDLRSPFGVALMLFSAQIVVDQVTRSVERILEGLNRVDLSRLIDSGRRTLVTGAVAVVAHTSGDLDSVALASLVASVPVALVTIGILLRHVRPRLMGRTETRELFEYGLRVGALHPLGTMHRMMDRVVVGAFLGPAAVTVVEVATQVQNGAESVLSASSYAVMPSASWLDARGDHDSQRRLLVLGTKYSVLIAAPVVVGAAVLAPALLDVWVGADLAEEAGVVAVALAYTLITAPAQVSSQMLVGLGRAGVIFRASLAALTVNLLVTVLLVPRVGVVGAFIGSLAGAPLILRFSIGGALSEVGTSPSHFLRRSVQPVVLPTIVLAATVAGVAAMVGSSMATLAVAIPMGGAVYGWAVWRWSIDRHELDEIRSSLRPTKEVGDDATVPT